MEQIETSPEGEVLAAFARFRDALVTCDTDTLDQLISPGYRGYNLQGGLESREVILEAYAPGVTTLEVWEMSELHVEVLGEVALLSGQGYLAGAWKGHPWHHYLRFLDVWVRQGGVWRVHTSQATPMEPPKEEGGEGQADG